MSKIALGTAQFGMDYGINNKRGKVHPEEAHAIMREAIASGIDTIDTAWSYGESEAVVGAYVKECRKEVKIISKLPECRPSEAEDRFRASLKRLGVSTLYGYLVHGFQHYTENQVVWGILEGLRENGKVRKVGFSLYYPYELEYIFEKGLKIDIVQFPFSIFDQRFLPYIPELKKRDVEINVRSIFLQGLFFKEPRTLGGRFIKIRDKLARLRSMARKSGFPIVSLCVNFTVLNELIDRVIVGVDSLENFREIMQALGQGPRVRGTLGALSEFREDDENILLPINWKVCNECAE